MKAREFWIDERTGSIVKYDGEIAFGDNFQFVRVREVPDSPDTQSAEAAESYRIGLSRRREFSDDEMADAFLAGVQWNQSRLDEAERVIALMDCFIGDASADLHLGEDYEERAANIDIRLKSYRDRSKT